MSQVTQDCTKFIPTDCTSKYQSRLDLRLLIERYTRDEVMGSERANFFIVVLSKEEIHFASATCCLTSYLLIISDFNCEQPDFQPPQNNELDYVFAP